MTKQRSLPESRYFSRTVSLSLGSDDVAQNRWLNREHAPEYGSDAPPIGKVSEEHLRAAYMMHTCNQARVDLEVQRDGNLVPVALMMGGVLYNLTPSPAAK